MRQPRLESRAMLPAARRSPPAVGEECSSSWRRWSSPTGCEAAALAAADALAFAAFCAASSAVYLLNDLADREEDRRHPVKRLRPIASGALPVAAPRSPPRWSRWRPPCSSAAPLGAGFLAGPRRLPRC